MLKVYHALLNRLIRLTFNFWQWLGIHVTRCHFYEPIPDIRELNENIWQKSSQLVGIRFDLKEQLNLLSQFKTLFKKEYDKFPAHETDVPHQYFTHNRAIEAVDGEILYCMIRYFKPRRIVEVGSGYSTYLTAQAILHNTNYDDHDPCELTAIEPYPNKILKKGFNGLTRLLSKPVQEVTLHEFTKLRENDMLLIDSSHVLKIGSDVQHEYLEILPRLNKGVIISIHDIFLPWEYRKDWVLRHHRFWNEQYLLQAFLMFNDSFEILWMGSYMHLEQTEELQAAFDSYNPQKDWPGFFWIRKIK